METKFTKGEWLYSEYNSGDFGVYSAAGKSYDIALVRSYRDQEEVRANTMLIAAAPEMLEKLNDCIETIDIALASDSVKKDMVLSLELAARKRSIERLIYKATK